MKKKKNTEELHRLAYNASFNHFGLAINGVQVDWSVQYYDILANTVGKGRRGRDAGLDWWIGLIPEYMESTV